ncbi:hypothetical protein [Paraburkholderia humisilvae]|uniref:Uncharacterized protein n=1 Tax=Paraburkholderia humisilvae TaxID=627669 RepID=A0A6J5DN98_9BURK|nr:hypothetical protein [Paraburkholderia humisilvae]CAB3754711.1 hypothetical protein LMG29542_02431 [Paraburkholderia humisilvae]
MAISLIRSLTASVARNVSTLKRDAKRLQKHSKTVFGTAYPLSTCQKAVAVSRGFKSLADVESLARRLGLDRNAPWWTILSRNDAHQNTLSALYQLEIQLSESGPVVFTGKQADAILPALVLFFEEMSARQMPGLIMVDTEAAAVQDTPVFSAVEKLGMEEMFADFRSLDLRERNLPVALDTPSKWWVRSIISALPLELERKLQDNGWAQGLELSAHENARSRLQLFGTEDFAAIPFYSVKDAASYLVHGTAWPAWMSEESSFLASEIGRKPPLLEDEAKRRVMEVITELDRRNFKVGVMSLDESRRRPFIVLFSRHDPASEVLAGVVHSYYYWRQVHERERHSPILLVSDGATPYAPRLLTFGNHTAVVNGLDAIPSGDGPGEFYGYKNALNVVASANGLQFMGTRVPIESVAIPA